MNFDSLVSPNRINPNIIRHSRPSIKKTQGYDVEYPIGSLKHNLIEELDELSLSFTSFDTATSFSIDYEISAANVPDLIKGKLNVVIEKSLS